MKSRKELKQKLDPPTLDIETDLDDHQLFEMAMADVSPIDRGRTARKLRKGPRKSNGTPVLPEQPLLDFMSSEGEIESRYHPDYVEGGSRQWDRRLLRKLRQGGFSVQESLDLHGLNQLEARESLDHFLRSAAGRGLYCVRIVHGKGLNSPNNEAVLRKRVPEWLSHRRNAAYVIAFASATYRDGGSGATYVLLRTAGKTPSGPRD